jgi:hypothetical protein
MQQMALNQSQTYVLVRFAIVTLFMMGAIIAAPFPLLLGYIYGCGWAHMCL